MKKIIKTNLWATLSLCMLQITTLSAMDQGSLVPEKNHILFSEQDSITIKQKEIDEVLVQATIRNNLEVMQEAIDQKANLETPDLVGNTPLINAVGSKSIDAVKLLLSAEADVNAQSASASKNTALIKTTELNMISLIEIIIAYGADPTITNFRNETAEQTATNNRFTQNAEEYLKAVNSGLKNFIQNPINFRWEPIGTTGQALQADLFWNNLYYGIAGKNGPNTNYCNYLSSIIKSYKAANKEATLNEKFMNIAKKDPLLERRERFAHCFSRIKAQTDIIILRKSGKLNDITFKSK